LAIIPGNWEHNIMPLFDYACKECGDVTEVHVQYPHVAPCQRECPKCGAMAVKIVTAPTIIQKGYKSGDARFNRGKGI
jgi:putative FmdB family regulatory protein